MDNNTAQIIRELADKLGTTTEHVVSVMARYEYSKAVTVLAIILSIGTAWIVFCSYWIYRDNKSNHRIECTPVCVFGMILAVVAIVATTCINIPTLFCSEAVAIQNLIGSIR